VGRHLPPPRQSVTYGEPAAGATLKALAEAGASRALLVGNASLAVPGGPLECLRAQLGDVCVGVLTGVRAHTPREDVARIARALRDSHADAVIGLGGGSVCDAIKAARLCLANGVFEAHAMDPLRVGHQAHPALSPALTSVMIPTTLSAGEFTYFAGVTDERGPRKESYRHPLGAPQVVVLDPVMAVGTPRRLWGATGVRAVDHAIETWCSVNGTPHSDATSLHALRLLLPSLLRCRENPGDLEAILQCQVGAWMAIQGVACLVEMGASHGIGHALGGTAGMPHGETSCVMLPHVLRFNAATNAQRQAQVAQALGRAESAAEMVADLVAALDLPGRLRDAGVPPRLLPIVAKEAMRDPWIATNPRPIHEEAEILALLEAAW
jgi:maleylacetate reductase